MARRPFIRLTEKDLSAFLRALSAQGIHTYSETMDDPTLSSRGQAQQSRFAGSLVDSRFDHDSCGVGFVASIAGKPSHLIVQQALTALSRLAHRGATAADGTSSDGVGVMTAVPRELLLKACGVELAADRQLGVGMVFLPAEETRLEVLLSRCLASHDLEILAWRDVPTVPSALGEIALSAMPCIRQV